MEKIKVGIVGGSVNPQSWAIKSHIPALLHNQYCQLTAVSTSSRESAEKAKQVLHIQYGYDNYHSLMKNKDIDAVVVSVKAPLHYEIIKEAIENKKHVYSEWPLTNDIHRSQELAAMADNAKIHHVIGLQARQSDVVLQAKDIIAHKELGKILSAAMQVSTQGKGKIITDRTAYQADPSNGATLLDINGGHSLDLLTFLLGDFTVIKTISQNSFGKLYHKETECPSPQHAPDCWEIIGKIKDSISVAVSIEGGILPEFSLTIHGEKGTLKITQNHSAGHPQFGSLILQKCIYKDIQLIKSSSDVSFEQAAEEIENGVSQNYLTSVYNILAQDIRNNTFTLPDFNDGVKTQMLLNKIKKLQDK